jgi:Na+/H+ antiporter NhaA
VSEPSSAFFGRTVWHNKTALREFLRTETGSASVLAGATAAALVWANASVSSYDRVWATRLATSVGGSGLAMTLHEFVNSGLMALFFLVVGLEARREWDQGELRVRSRLALPVLVGLGGMIVPIGIYLIANAGRASAHAWGMSMATDTAFALGALALVGRRLPDRVRTYLLTFSVVDDLAGIAIIAVVYSGRIRVVPLLAGLGFLLIAVAIRARGVRYGPAYLLIGIAAWVAFFKSGVDPVVVGLVVGLMSYAYPATRASLEQASEAFRSFREQPTAELAQSARDVVRTAISPNDRLALLFHPWSSYLIVPLFALANAGIVLNASFLARAYTSPVTLGILLGYLVGKPAGTSGAAWLVTRLSHGRLRPPVGWGAVIGAGAVAGIGFTVSLLIASLALTGTDLAEAKLGILSAALCATGLTWVVFRAVNRLPSRPRLRALLGTAEVITDLVVPVDDKRDHIRGPEKAPVTVVEYGDFECPYCGLAEPAVRELLRDFGDVRYVWRHLPLTDVHPHAEMAAEATEAAAKQGAFWGLHDVLLEHQGALTMRDLTGYAASLGLDTERFTADLRKHAGATHVAEDVDSADLSGVSGTPTFFVNGMRHYGAYDIETLSKAVKLALARSKISALPVFTVFTVRLAGISSAAGHLRARCASLGCRNFLFTGGIMKRAFAAVATAVAASASICLATAPAYAKPVPKQSTAVLLVAPPWTYAGGGEFAVTAKCSVRSDLRVVFSPLLYRPVAVPGAGRLLIRVTAKSTPGKYTIGLLCVNHRAVADAVAIKTVTVRRQLAGWSMTSPRALPRHFKPNLTVQTGMRQVIVPGPARLLRHAARHR